MIKPTLASRLEARSYPEHLAFLMKQTWKDLLFMHWEFDPSVIQSTLPSELYVDTYEDKAFISITPFFMVNPTLPFTRNYRYFDLIEVNVRTYVYDKNGVPGIWFYSLDINSFFAAVGGRAFSRLPYFLSVMSATKNENSMIDFKVQRPKDSKTCEFTYKQGEKIAFSDDSLEFFLAERYVWFSKMNKPPILRGRVYHKPYVLSKASLIKYDTHLFQADGLTDPGRAPDYVHFSERVDADLFVPVKAESK